MRETWICLNENERKVVLNALRRAREGKSARSAIGKLNKRRQHPLITIGVHGGQVQWVLGNPFPIRICDYDGEGKADLPDMDERGQDCRMWFEPVDTSRIT